MRCDALLSKELLDGRVVAGVAERGHPLGLHVLEPLVGARPLRIEGGAALCDGKLGLRLDAARVELIGGRVRIRVGARARVRVSGKGVAANQGQGVWRVRR